MRIILEIYETIALTLSLATSQLRRHRL